MSKTKVLHVAAEIYPHVKTGGLADVIAALPPALIERGIDARLLLPGLPAILDALLETKKLAEFGPSFGAARVRIVRGRLPESGVPAYVIDAPWLYARSGNPYVSPDGSEWADNDRRFALLGWVAAHLASGEFAPTWRPDIVHAHDWHAGLAAAYLAQHPVKLAHTVFTIHNLAYQGLFDLGSARELGLSADIVSTQGLEFHGRGNFMKAGLLWSDRLTTVSPRYAAEIRTPEFGCGLEGVLESRADRLTGILNGVDYGVWNPATDQWIDHPFTSSDVAGKALCKAAVQRDLGLDEKPRAPLFTVVSRLTDQKGMDLLAAAIPALVAQGGQLALIGTGDRELERLYREASILDPANVAVRLEYDEALAHRLIAAGDAIVVPSRFEPCGLTQLYGLRYGTVPIVRRSGGLADTVLDFDADPGRATGFSFNASSAAALNAAISRAIAVYRDRESWRSLMERGMAQDFSWAKAADKYVSIYRGMGPSFNQAGSAHAPPRSGEAAWRASRAREPN